MNNTPIIGATPPPCTINEIRHYDIHQGDTHASIFAEVNMQTDLITFKTKVSATIRGDRGSQQVVTFPVEIMTAHLGDRTAPALVQVQSAFNMLMSPAYQEKAQKFVEGEIRRMQLKASIAEAQSAPASRFLR